MDEKVFGKKYELTGETKLFCGNPVYRIRRLEDGELGGLGSK